MSIRTKILIAGRNKQALEELAGRCELPAVEVAIKHINNGHADPLYGVVDDPDLLIFHAREDDVEELQCLVDRRPEARPATLVVGPAGNARLMRMAMQAGARDYLEEPLQEQEFRLALDRFLQERREQPGSANGSLMAVVSAKGGAGASFLAVNLAHILATQSKLATTLLDLDLQFGSLAQYLDLRPKSGLMSAIDMADSLDAVAADACMAKHASSLGLLAPQEDEIVLSRDIPTDRFSRLLQLLKQSYERVVVDLPRQIDEVSATVYEQADKVLVVIQQELACLRDAARLRSLLTRELGIPPERILTVVNRYEKSLPVELDDICQGLGITRDSMSIIPNHYRSVAESINVGVPMTEHARSSVVTKSLMSLGSQLGGAESDGERAGIFSRTFQMMRG
jgi:pilus assembly protein CpaE